MAVLNTGIQPNNGDFFKITDSLSGDGSYPEDIFQLELNVKPKQKS